MAVDRSVELQQLRPSDHQSWMPLWRGYQEFYRVEIPAETTEVTWERLLDPKEPVHGVLAWRDGQAIGLVHWIRHRSCWTPGDYAYLNDLFVDPDARGAGVGRMLIEHVYAEAAAAGCSRVYWLTHETNSVAMQLYDRIAERSGFVQYRKQLG